MYLWTRSRPHLAPSSLGLPRSCISSRSGSTKTSNSTRHRLVQNPFAVKYGHRAVYLLSTFFVRGGLLLPCRTHNLNATTNGMYIDVRGLHLDRSQPELGVRSGVSHIPRIRTGCIEMVCNNVPRSAECHHSTQLDYHTVLSQPR